MVDCGPSDNATHAVRYDVKSSLLCKRLSEVLRELCGMVFDRFEKGMIMPVTNTEAAGAESHGKWPHGESGGTKSVNKHDKICVFVGAFVDRVHKTSRYLRFIVCLSGSIVAVAPLVTSHVAREV